MINSYMASQHNRISRKRIFIAGPVTGSGEVIENMERAADAATELIDLGYSIYCPHSHGFHLDPACRLKHKTWLEISLAWLPYCDAVLRLPGASGGADQECRAAFDRGIPIYKSIQELTEKCPP